MAEEVEFARTKNIRCKLFGHKFLASHDKLRDICSRCGHKEFSLFAVKELIAEREKRYKQAGIVLESGL